MNKKLIKVSNALLLTEFKHIFKIMKLTSLFGAICVSSAFAANVNSQTMRVNINANGQQTKEIIKQIEDQTDYLFVYNSDKVNLNNRVTVNVNNETVAEVLNQMFAGTDIAYAVQGNNILLLKKDAMIQQQANVVKGTVVDEAGIPIIGANVIIKGTTNGTITDMDGNFSLEAEKGATLVVSYIGYTDYEVKVSNQKNLSITLKEDSKALDEVVVVGYGTQKKVTLTGAVSAIKTDEIVKTKNENVQNMLSGKIPGVRVVQKSAEPGSFNNSFDIRGMGDALVVIDGVPRDNMTRLDPNDIESLSILKDASAAIYGVRAANGVVLITTKKGKAGHVELEYSGNMGWQNPTGSPKSVSAVDWMTLKNESNMRNINGGIPSFSQEEINDYRTGKLQGTDWWGACMRTIAPQTQHSLNVTGGTEKLNYFISGGYLYQESFLKSKSLDYDRFNLRSNITSKVTDRLSVSLNMSGIMDEKNQPYESAAWIIRAFQRAPARQPIYANNNPDYLLNGWIEGDNPVAMMDADQVGYQTFNNKWFQASTDVTYDVPWIEGLKAKAMFSYDYQIADNKIFEKSYNQYTYDAASDTYQTHQRVGVSKFTREHYSKDALLYQLSLNYSHMFNDEHNVNGLLLFEGSKRNGDNFFAKRELSLLLDQLFAGNTVNQEGNMRTDDGALYRQANLGLVGKFGYDFKSKYLAEFSFRYDGSSKFGSGAQWGFFPAGSIGWRISEEDFWKDSKMSFINNAKIRASYGKMGDDRASSYQFINGYYYPGGGFDGQGQSGTVFDGAFVSGAVSKGLINPFITWYVSKTFDIGADVEAWNGLLGLTFDYFARDRSGLLATRNLSLPGVVGASLPQENLNGDFTHGVEVELSHRNKIGDFGYNVKGIFSFTRTKNTYQERGRSGNSYENWRDNGNDRFDEIMWGIEGDGQYNNWNDILNSPLYAGNGTLPGDYKYVDYNGDGMITGLDHHPIGYRGRPMINFSLNLGAEYKGFDLNALFQGAGMSFVQYVEQIREPMWGNDNSNALEYFMDRWHPVDPLADPWNPATQWVSGEYAYGKNLSDFNSTFNFYNARYIRLKNIELGYTFPTKWIEKVGMNNLRLYVNAYNLFTIDGVALDPEHPNDENGNLYPLNRTFSVGVNVKF